MAASSTNFPKEQRRKKKHQTPGHALKSSLRQAAAQKRLTVGLNNCVNKLKRNPETVMVCLMLRNPATQGKAKDQVGCNIQQTLLQAFCAESRISVMQVLENAALSRLVGQLAGKLKVEDADGCWQDGPVDCSILIIEHPEGSPSAEDLAWATACQDGHLDLRTTNNFPTG
ncbi:hypothetical protein V1264_023315 [Littorina saxatilis]